MTRDPRTSQDRGSNEVRARDDEARSLAGRVGPSAVVEKEVDQVTARAKPRRVSTRRLERTIVSRIWLSREPDPGALGLSLLDNWSGAVENQPDPSQPTLSRP